MGWKDWSYPVRGGILSIFIVLVISVIYGLIALKQQGLEIMPFVIFFQIFLIPAFFVSLFLMMSFVELPEILYILIGTISSVIVWFFVGYLIGWIVKKIRKK